MSRLQITQRIAWAAGMDEGNRHAQAAGRSVWNEEDYDAAVAEFNRLWPEPQPITPLEIA